MTRWLSIIPYLTLACLLAAAGVFASFAHEGWYHTQRDGPAALLALQLSGVGFTLALLSGPPICAPRTSFALRRRVLLVMSVLLPLAVLLYCIFSGERGTMV